MSTLKTVNLQNPASGTVNSTLNSDGTVTFGGVVNFASAQTFPNAITSLTAGTGLLGGTVTTIGTFSLDTAYTDTLYLPLTGGTMTGNIVFASTQIFPNAVSSVTAGTGLTGGTITTSGTINLDTAYTDGLYLGLAGGTMTGDITFSGTQSFPAQDLDTVTSAGNTTANSIDVGGVVASGLTYPAADGAAGDYLSTDGSGTLGWVVPPVEDLQTVTDNGAVTTNSVDVGGLTASGLIYPASDGVAKEVISTDGAGNLGWLATAEVVAVPGGSAAGGSFGQISFGGGNFYFHDGSQWWQVAGASF